MVEPKAGRPFMPGYGIPDTDAHQGLLSWSWAHARLERSHNYWLATVRPDGRPHVMPVWGLWLDGSFLFSTGRQSRKARNLATNAHCVVCTEQAEEAVILEGKVHRVSDTVLVEKFCEGYLAKYNWDMRAMLEEPIYRVEPVAAFGMIEASMMTTATRWTFGPAGRA